MYIPLRREIIETARRMNADGINRGTSGNLSIRVEGGFLITPTGMAYDELGVEDIVELDLHGKARGMARIPSSEWRIHADVYRTRPEVRGIVHAHPMYCTTLAIVRKDIPAVHYMIAVAGGPTVRCAPYRTFGTPELSAVALEALEGRKACLLANHGMIALGKDLAEAFKVAREVETVAEQYWRALQVGAPTVLDDEEMKRVLEKFKTYGQQR